jgi:6-phosphogluconolactonase (cycloisomerase 2 family)
VHVLKLAYFQMAIEKLQAQNTSYRISFDNQIKELQLRRTTTLAQLQQELGTANAAYLAIQKEIESVYGIQLKDYTFNPDSGMLNKIVDQSKKQDGAGPTTPAPAQ